MRLNKEDLHNKVTFSEICDVEKPTQQVKQERLTNLKEVRSGAESASGRTEERRSDIRKPLEVVQNFVIPESAKPSYSPYS